MYNRYTPQPDGSYRRDHIPEKQAPPKPEPPPAPCDIGPEPPRRKPKEGPVDSFLRQLLPKNFDTGDLFIVLLLLLMAGDSEEGKANALLTLALYFIM